MFMDGTMPKSQTITEDSSREKEVTRLRDRLFCLRGTNSAEEKELESRLQAIDYIPVPRPTKGDQKQGKRVVRFG